MNLSSSPRIRARFVKHIRKLTQLVGFSNMIINSLHLVMVFFSGALSGCIIDFSCSCSCFANIIGLQRALGCKTTLGVVLIFILWRRLVRDWQAYAVSFSLTAFRQRGIAFAYKRWPLLVRTVFWSVIKIRTNVEVPRFQTGNSRAFVSKDCYICPYIQILWVCTPHELRFTSKPCRRTK